MRGTLVTALTIALASTGLSAQTQSTDNVSVSTTTLLDAAGPTQRAAIKSIYLVVCVRDNISGSAFLLKNGVIVTNHHVVGSCEASDLVVVDASNAHVPINAVISDANIDLALLKPAEKLAAGLELADGKDPLPGTAVTTWGYPFLYNGVSPLLSVGYVAGFRDAPIKHIIVNGAFNHGNSGGPLLLAHDNKVVGVVVLTYNFFPKYVKDTIEKLRNTPVGVFFGATDASGKGLSEVQVTGLLLQEFYDKTQVVIGEAISSSELRKFINARGQEIGVSLTTVQPAKVRRTPPR